MSQKALPNIPPLDAVLVDALDKRFPERCPDPEWTDRKVWIEVGKREVIRFLLNQLERQQDNILQVKN
jgi:hypothetical protein